MTAMVKNKQGFTVKQQRFIDCYDGDIKKAAKKADLSYGYCKRMMMITKGNCAVKGAIRNRQEIEIRPKTIANRQERQKFWTDTMKDKKLSRGDRLRGSELLGKSECDFVERIKHEIEPQTIADIAAIMASRRAK